MRIDAPSEHQVFQLLALWKTAFGEHGGFWELFRDTAFRTDHCRCIRAEGQVLAALCWLDCACSGQTFAYIYAVVTHPEHRGQGLCRELLADTHAHLTALGYSGVLLVPEQEGLRQMYRRLGYRDCTTVTEFSCAAAETAVPLRAIGPAEYGRLRRAFLPEGGVVQEGRSLDFLAAQAQFFAGGSFLLAAYREEGILHGMELLGSREAAPGIVTALGCETGHFRTPGEEKPFAMLHPLTANALMPQYFGFAFD